MGSGVLRGSSAGESPVAPICGFPVINGGWPCRGLRVQVPLFKADNVEIAKAFLVLEPLLHVDFRNVVATAVLSFW